MDASPARLPPRARPAASLACSRSREIRLRALVRGFADLLVPPRCGSCRAASRRPLCTACRAALEPDLDATPIPHLDTCVAAVAYAGEVPAWMQRFKYPGAGFSRLDSVPIGILQHLITEAARSVAGPAPEIVVPVPLHPKRLRARGFNPAGLLSRAVAKAVGVRASPRALRRIRDTPSQTGLDRAARQRNVTGAFVCGSPPPRTVWLVDDVVTTGATLAECARVLRRRGTRHVLAVCVARTPRSHQAPQTPAKDANASPQTEERLVRLPPGPPAR